ncbi:3-methyl-2-oxobutanoate hydroxymethyltransferase [Striga asiatica]|uniref:3-methyl-2-oxobutanoate hydroxymethyltransferase n=1 Tax=Striga asiatica TaxID=4170 RepID=A0A5A7Q0N7_STRAF|nr:3-methyl-2-oxobutanoate hydroxymethyltransferase [Striga asiatica]
MAAEIQELLPPLNNLIKKIIKLPNNILNPNPQLTPQLIHGSPRPPKFVKQKPDINLGNDPLVKSGRRYHKCRPKKQVPLIEPVFRKARLRPAINEPVQKDCEQE